MLLVLAAAIAHGSLCEWRTVAYDAAGAAEIEERVLWVVRRVAHPAGNAAAFDARKAQLRAYHGDWLACWEGEGETEAASSACRTALDSGADATTRAVRVAECEVRLGARRSGRASFRRCLLERGHPEAAPPHWTRDDFGPRFAGPYWTLTALLAEDLGGPPAMSRAVAGGLGVAFPAALCLGALARLRRGGRRPASTRDVAGGSGGSPTGRR